jgi:hypothetical protein
LVSNHDNLLGEQVKHWKYLKYLLKHKWYVYRAGRKYGVGYLQLFIHDWSKFLPSEWFPYVEYFYGTKDGWTKHSFQMAWNYHQKRQPHHWQYWLLTKDTGEIIPLPIPEKYVREMVADWDGAGMAISGKSDTKEWYLKNRNTILIHPASRLMVEDLLGIDLPEPETHNPNFPRLHVEQIGE